MLSSEFEEILNEHLNIKKHYEGCFSADLIPKRIKKYNFIICNTDISSNEGQHWYTFIRTSSTEVNKMTIFASYLFQGKH